MMRTLAVGCAILGIVACADSKDEHTTSLSAECTGPVTQSIRYDQYGRRGAIQRPGTGEVQYLYDPTTGLLASKVLPDRTVAFEYDASGRLIEQTATKGGDVRTIQIHYDENGELGFITRVSSAGWEKRFVHRSDGMVTSAIIDIPGFRSVTLSNTYYANGYEESTTRTVRDSAGVVLSQVSRTTLYDAVGRPSAMELNGQPLYAINYDGEGRIGEVTFAGGSTLSFAHDLATHRRSGYQQEASDFELSAAWSFDDRGLIASESYQRDADAIAIDYQHDARGFLIGETGPAAATYEYGADGRPLIAPAGYAFDGFGRMVAKGDLILEYGPSGDVERATRGPRIWTFDYDEAGRRLVKREGGAVVMAYLFNGTLNATSFIEPMYVADRMVGVLVDAAFVPLATDARGSVVAGEGTWDWPSAYGARVLRPEIAEAVDYAEKGFDPDLGSVRMGIRDFDPELSRFWTPDPLFFEEDPNQCIKSPLECNLFSYANNDPTRYRDPTGRNARIMRDETNHVIRIEASIGIWGSQASDAAATLIETDINTMWGAVPTWTDPKTHQNYTLQVNVSVVNLGRSKPSDEHHAYWEGSGGRNLIEINTTARSFVRTGHLGQWNINDVSDATRHVAAHEFGHLLGIDDKYVDGITNGKPNGTSFPKPGWAGHLMADTNGVVNQRQLDLVLPFAFNKKPDIRAGQGRNENWYFINVKDHFR